MVCLICNEARKWFGAPIRGLLTTMKGGLRDMTILEQILVLKDMALPELQKKYSEVFNGKKATSNNKTYLWQRIAYRIQELECGGLSQEAQDKLKELIDDYDPINNKTLRPERDVGQNAGIPRERLNALRDRRLPIPGTILAKEYKGKNIQVKALEKGFEYNGKFYKTLTAIAKDVTGSHWNGYLFFNL